MIPVILSGGSGSRLWPLSRKQFPKQFLALTGEHTLFQQTLERLVFDGMQAPIVVCNKDHKFIVNEQLTALNLQTQAILMEPFGRNTAPAVAITAMKLVNEGSDELMLVLPADHVIDDQKALQRALALATVAAERGEMVLFGVPATKPETGYGYIRSSQDALLPEGVARVAQFVEKPDEKRATEFVRSGGYFWNSGMFLFKASRFLAELEKFHPAMLAGSRTAWQKARRDSDFTRLDKEAFAAVPSDSIDYAVMEKTADAVVVPLDAGWNDVGSWTALRDVSEQDGDGNAHHGDVIAIDCRNTFAYGERLIALVGLDDVIVVETDDAVMVGKSDRMQEIKQVVARIKAEGRPEATWHRKVYRPWGAYDSIDNGARFQVKRITVKPGATLSLQMHHHRAEHWIVVSGTAEVTRGEEVLLLTENQSTYIPLGVTHRLKNPGKLPLELIEVQSGSYLGEDDIVRFEDTYGRT